ncbi:hypothetical protein LMG28727_03751 [Paraburkholderia kirstenboschensis]|nr:hypothetical protein LMG28727_03751 [Paraburkholderia kirstenboschensis]
MTANRARWPVARMALLLATRPYAACELAGDVLGTRIHAQPAREGMQVGRKRVVWLMCIGRDCVGPAGGAGDVPRGNVRGHGAPPTWYAGTSALTR